jgi:NADH dehydrogenase/NADH:ubiquinone oxidoreductase subunit G
MMASICPGCSIGCGLYVDEDKGETGTGIKIRHRKRSPVNQGKLCGFGMDLSEYYSRELLKPKVDGKEVVMEEVIDEAKNRLSSFLPDEVAFLTLAETTNEELLSFKNLADSIGCENMDFGFGRFIRMGYQLPGFPLDEIEDADNIILFFVDPFVQYPLLARRILIAKKKGASIKEIAFAENERKIANESESIIIDPSEEIEIEEIADRLRLNDDEGSIIIADLNPNTDPAMFATMQRLSSESESLKLLIMNPFLNSTGAFMLGLHRGDLDLFEIIEKDDLKALYLLETDLITATLDRGLEDALSKLELLIVQNAFETRIADIANVCIPSEPFFQKRGSIVNIEGRVIENEGFSTNGFDMIKGIRIGGEPGPSYDEIHKDVLDRLSIGRIDEDEIPLKRKREGIENQPKPEIEMHFQKKGDYFLVYKTNPFLWHGIRHKGFVEMSSETVRKLKLNKGDEIAIISNSEGETEMETTVFRVSELPERIVLSEIKLAPARDIVSWVNLQKK